jgi:hypothetical protein
VQGATPARMLRELGHALVLLAADIPLVLVLEDLHWSDSSTVEDAFAFSAIGNPLTATFARGKTNHPRHCIATESSRAPPPAQADKLAWRRGSHRPASAAATDVQHSWRPVAGLAGDHTSGSRWSGCRATY